MGQRLTGAGAAWALPLGVLGDQRRAKVSITDPPSADHSLPFLHRPSLRPVLPSGLPNHSQTVMWSETCPGEVGGGVQPWKMQRPRKARSFGLWPQSIPFTLLSFGRSANRPLISLGLEAAQGTTGAAGQAAMRCLPPSQPHLDPPACVRFHPYRTDGLFAPASLTRHLREAST